VPVLQTDCMEMMKLVIDKAPYLTLSLYRGCLHAKGAPGLPRINDHLSACWRLLLACPPALDLGIASWRLPSNIQNPLSLLPSLVLCFGAPRPLGLPHLAFGGFLRPHRAFF